jgi:hypothetical protein
VLHRVLCLLGRESQIVSVRLKLHKIIFIVAHGTNALGVADILLKQGNWLKQIFRLGLLLILAVLGLRLREFSCNRGDLLLATPLGLVHVLERDGLLIYSHPWSEARLVGVQRRVLRRLVVRIGE